MEDLKPPKSSVRGCINCEPNQFLRIGRDGNVGLRVTRGRHIGVAGHLGGKGQSDPRAMVDPSGRERRAGQVGLRITRSDPSAIADSFGRERRAGQVGLRITRSDPSAIKGSDASGELVDYFGRI